MPKRPKKPTDPELEALRAKLVERTPEQARMALRRKVKILYDLQMLRMQAAARTQPKAGGAEIQLHEYDLALLVKKAAGLEAEEKDALKVIEEHLQTIPFYVNVLSDKERYKGIGPTLAGVILSEFDIVQADTVSKMWHYAGLAPTPALRCRHCHSLVKETTTTVTTVEGHAPVYEHVTFKTRSVKPGEEVEAKPAKVCPKQGQALFRADLIDSGKAMRPVKGEKLSYNSFLRAKLCGVLGPNLLKLGSPYRKYYDDYKHRWASAGKGNSDKHRHMAAIRYMVKMLLLDIWKAWRAFEGLPIRPSYQEEKLGHITSMTPVGT